MILNLFSGPRNVSTALMYSFAQRSDTQVIDEPWYAYYLLKTGAAHPGKEEVLNSMESDPDRILADITKLGTSAPVLFIKNMSHHFIDLDLSLLSGFENIFLIREPADMLLSLINQLPEPALRDTGLKNQWFLFKKVKESGKDPAVIDARILLGDPGMILEKLCLKTGLPFQASMLHWKEGPRPEDGVWAKYWYQNVHRSTGFKNYEEKHISIPDNLRPLLDECNFYYNKLFQFVIQ